MSVSCPLQFNSEAAPSASTRILIPAEIVLSTPGELGWSTMLLRMKNGGNYAVCVVHEARGVATAPNYAAQDPDAKFFGTLSKGSLLSILDWTDRETAVRRYAGLVSEPRSVQGNIRSIFGRRMTHSAFDQSPALA